MCLGLANCTRNKNNDKKLDPTTEHLCDLLEELLELRLFKQAISRYFNSKFETLNEVNPNMDFDKWYDELISLERIRRNNK